MDWIAFTKIGKSYSIQNGKKYIYFIREKKLFDEDTFREAWTNAVVHNKWVEGIPPAVYWYDDRLEIVSYGTIPNGMTKEDFLSGKTHPVNEELMKIFLQCHIVEQTGHGVPKVVRKYGAKAYDFGTSTIAVTIPFDRSGFKNKQENATVNATAKLTNTEKAILSLISEDKAITVGGLSEKIGKHRTTILRALSQLKEKKTYRKSRLRKTGHWEIKK